MHSYFYFMAVFQLYADVRTLKGKKTHCLRAAGKVPAVVYGAQTKPENITIDRNAFLKLYQSAGESSLVELTVDQQSPLHVLIQDFQTDPVIDDIIHVDFRSVDLTKEIEATVDLEFIGEAPAVKTLGGTLVLSREYVDVRCLPTKLVRRIRVDLSPLATFEDGIRVKDLVLPEGMTVIDDPALSIAVVMPPRSEEELASLDRAVEVDVSAVEVVGKKEEEEGEEAKEKGEKDEKDGSNKKHQDLGI